MITGWRDPEGNEAQRGALHSMKRWNYLIGGRGVGKTAWMCIRAALFASMFRGLCGMITEQTAKDINDVLIPCWKAVVPVGSYTLAHNQYGFEAQFPNGSVIKFRGRHAKDTISDPPFHGQTVGYLGHDEISLDRRTDVITISGMMVRQEGMPNVVDLAATPRRNWLYSHMMGKGLVNTDPWQTMADDGRDVSPYKFVESPDGGSAAWYGPTSANRYNEGLHDRMVGEISEAEARQYLLGEWVDVEGLIWTQFNDEDYPNSNMIDDGGFKAGQDYVLSVDHGSVDSSWGIWQARGEGRYSRVAEYTPHHIPGYRIAREVEDKYGKPARVITGADHVTRGNAGLSTDHLFTSMGWPRADRVTGDLADKEIQGNILTRKLCNTDGKRCVLISKQMEQHYPGKTRGALEVLKNDVWPDSGSRDYFRKEKDKNIFHEDTRDDLLYFSVVMWPPAWGQYTNWAA